MKNVAPEQLALLSQLEEFRKRHESKSEPSDWAIRMCQAIVAHSLGFIRKLVKTKAIISL